MTETETTAVRNARLVADYLKRGWNQGQLDETVVGDEYVAHVNGPQNTTTVEEMQALVDEWRDALPDFELEVLDVFATDEKVAVHYQWTGTHEGEILGAEPTGTTVEMTGMAHFHLDDGQLVEAWYAEDTYRLRDQLGDV